MLISIVTICFNCKDELVKTVESVNRVKNNRIEYIVVDGASTDGTTEVLTSCEAIDIFVSEPDSGIYDAMNKGVRLANGDYILFLNAGDILYSGFSFDCVLAELGRSGPDVLVGNAYIEKFSHKRLFKRRSLEYLEFGMPFCHQSVFTRASLLKEQGFNLLYDIASDFEFYYSIFKRGCSILYIDDFVSEVDGHGVSNTNKLKSTKERYSVIKSSGSMKPVLKVRFFYHLVRSIISDAYNKFFRLL